MNEKELELVNELIRLRFLLRQIVDSLPTNIDWLDPDIEKAIKEAIK